VTDDLQARLARRSTVRRAVGFTAISGVIVLSVLGRSATEPAPRSALGGTDLAQPIGPSGASAAPAGAAPGSAPAAPRTSARHSKKAPQSAAPHTAAPHTTAPHTTAAQTAAPHTTAPHSSTAHSTAPHPTAPPTTPRTTPPTTAPVTTQRTVTGAAYDVSYGTVQLRVTFKGRQIVDVTALSMPQGGRSGDISARAEPQLRREALAAQSANINAVSGASYTSAGYAKSLQSAIDKAGV
jgi:uncharacterized protein with FMN-binding domain